MADLSIPVHLAVHVLGLAVAFGLAGVGVSRRLGLVASIGLALGGTLLATTHLLTGMLATGEQAWPLYLRVAGYAALAVGAVGTPLTGAAPVVIAAAPVGAYAAAAVASLMAAIAAARGALGRGRAVLPLVTGLLLWGASDAVTPQNSTIAAALSIGGSAAVLAWLFERSRGSLAGQFFVSFLAVVLVVVVGLATIGGAVFSQDLEREQLTLLDDLASAPAQQFSTEWPLEVLQFASLFGGTTLHENLVNASGERPALDSLAQNRAQVPGIDVVAIVNLAGEPVGSWDSAANAPLPVAPLRLIAGDELVSLGLGGVEKTGLIALADGQLIAVGVAPVFPVVDSLPRLDDRSGVLVVGRRITDSIVVEDVARTAGTEATLLVDGAAVTSTLSDREAADVVEAVRANATSRRTELDGTSWYLSAQPITAEDASVVGHVVLTLEASATADVEDDTARSLFGGALAGFLVAGLLGAAAARRTTKPVVDLTAAAERVAAGDLNVRVGLDRADEVGRLATSFDGMTAALERREEELRMAAITEAELRSRIEAVTSSMGEALLAVDLEDRVTTVNPAAAELLGRSESSLLGMQLAKVLVGRTDDGRTLQVALGRPERRSRASVRGHLLTEDDERPVAASAAPLVDSAGELAGRVHVLRDVSAEVEADRAMKEFLANVSHELNTPLTPIKAYAQLIISKNLDRARTVEFARVIEGRALKLERLTRVLITFAQLSRGEGTPHGTATVRRVVDDAMEKWRTQWPDRTFNRRIAKDIGEVGLDPRMLAVVLDELVDNAVKFSDGPVSIRGERDENEMRITVADQGVGIDADQVDHIRAAFRQGDGGATRRYGGLGIGLPLVERILTFVDGELLLDSVPDEGTQVTVVLPVSKD